MTFIASASTVAGQYHGRTITINGGVSTLFSIIVNEPGDGSETNPFRVYDVASLLQVGRNTRSGWTRSAHYRQEANIDIISIPNWTPIGTGLNPFIGTYNGDGYTIRNLTINSTEIGRGLFRYVGTDGVVYNLALRDVDITANASTVGGVAGDNRGKIHNCYVTGNIRGNQQVYGGVVGSCSSALTTPGIIEDCYSTVNITGSHAIGGVVGRSAIIRNCYATGNMSGSGTFGNIGGVIGIIDNHGTGTVQNLVALNRSVVTTTSTTNIGRVVGAMSSGTPINVYGRLGMTLTQNNGDPVTITPSTTNRHGEHCGSTDWHSTLWWRNTVGFSDTSWDIVSNRLPRLRTDKGQPFKEEQNPVP